MLTENRELEIHFFTLMEHLIGRVREKGQILSTLAILTGQSTERLMYLLQKIRLNKIEDYEYYLFFAKQNIPIRKLTHLPLNRKQYYAYKNGDIKSNYTQKESLLNIEELQSVKNILGVLSR